MICSLRQKLFVFDLVSNFASSVFEKKPYLSKSYLKPKNVVLLKLLRFALSSFYFTTFSIAFSFFFKKLFLLMYLHSKGCTILTRDNYPIKKLFDDQGSFDPINTSHLTNGLQTCNLCPCQLDWCNKHENNLPLD